MAKDLMKQMFRAVEAVEAPKLAYEMSPAQFAMLKSASNPPKIATVSRYGAAALDPVERARIFWQKLGREMLFDPETVQPMTNEGKHLGWFRAHPATYDEDGNLTESIRTIDARAAHGIAYNTTTEQEKVQNVEQENQEGSEGGPQPGTTLH